MLTQSYLLSKLSFLLISLSTSTFNILFSTSKAMNLKVVMEKYGGITSIENVLYLYNETFKKNYQY